MYDGYPVDNFRLDPDHDISVPTNIDPGHDAMPKDYQDLDPGHDRGEWPNPPIIEDIEPKRLTEADLMRLAGQLERAEEQGWRFERYSHCGVSDHRHRWEITSKICQVWRWRF